MGHHQGGPTGHFWCRPYRHALSNVTAFRTTQNMKMTTNNPSISKRPFLSDAMIVKEDRGGSYQVMMAEKRKMSKEEQRKIIQKLQKLAGHQLKVKFRREH